MHREAFLLVNYYNKEAIPANATEADINKLALDTCPHKQGETYKKAVAKNAVQLRAQVRQQQAAARRKSTRTRPYNFRAQARLNYTDKESIKNQIKKQQPVSGQEAVETYHSTTSSWVTPDSDEE